MATPPIETQPQAPDESGGNADSSIRQPHHRTMTTTNSAKAAATAAVPSSTKAASNPEGVEHHTHYNGFSGNEEHHYASPLVVDNSAGYVEVTTTIGTTPEMATPQIPYSDGEGTAPATASAGDITENDACAIDMEEEPLKLFVGQVPKQMSEEDIFPTFDAFGPLKDVAIIRDKHTGLHRGCAFVTYWSPADAQKAQMALHDQFTFPGAKRPTQVKPAEPSVPENKLFIGMLSRMAGEEDVKQLFQEFGEIKEIHMIRSSDGSSRCAAFLRFLSRDAAIQAIEKLNNSIVMEGAARPLIVKFADNKHQRQQRHYRNIRKQEMLSAAVVGATMAPNYPLPGAYQASTPSGGPQLPMHPTPPIGPGNAPHPYSTMPPPHPSQFSHHHHHAPPHHYVAGPPHPYLYHPHHQQHAPYLHTSYGPPAASHVETGTAAGKNNNPRPREGPAGANLFVYHLPHDLTDADLATAFNSFGNVVSAKVYVDKYTGESKGFGFVSYDSVISAEAAIEQMNGFQIGNKRLKVQHKRVHGMNLNLPVHRGVEYGMPLEMNPYAVSAHPAEMSHPSSDMNSSLMAPATLLEVPKDSS